MTSGGSLYDNLDGMRKDHQQYKNMYELKKAAIEKSLYTNPHFFRSIWWYF